MVTTATTPASSLAGRLSSKVRNLAGDREIVLDLKLSGRPQATSERAGEVLEQVVDLVVDSAGSSADMHHLALDVNFLGEELQVRLEHDAALEPASRARLEEGALAAFEAIGALGGSLSLSAGRGFGMRIEVSLPYDSAGRAAATPRVTSSALGVDTGRPPDRAIPNMVEKLTAQESICLNLLATGLSNKEIARKMNLSLGTVKFHLAQIYQKLGVQGRGRGAAVARARELGLVFD